MLFKDVLIRNIEATSYRENFLISAIVSIFVIRVYLRFTHYPKIGSGEFHIAHLLFGGFFMMAALIILLSFSTKKQQSFHQFSAALALALLLMS